jgi:hypothetical protein
MSQDSVLGTLADCASSRGLVNSLAIPGLASWGTLSRPSGLFLVIIPTQDYSQPSLRDSVRKWSSHAGYKGRTLQKS